MSLFTKIAFQSPFSNVLGNIEKIPTRFHPPPKHGTQTDRVPCKHHREKLLSVASIEPPLAPLTSEKEKKGTRTNSSKCRHTQQTKKPKHVAFKNESSPCGDDNGAHHAGGQRGGTTPRRPGSLNEEGRDLHGA